MANSYYALSWIGLIFTGIAVLWSLQITYRGHRSRTHGSQLPLLMNTIGWLLIMMGVLGPLATVNLAFSIVLLPLAPIVAAMAVQRFRLSEFRMLNRQLALALQKGIPLERAARAFASERVDEVGDRTEQLAEDLALGIPLETAMRRARIPIPFELRMASRLGPISQRLPGLSLETDRDLYAGFPVIVDSLRQLCYLTTVMMVGILIITFVFIKIMPTFAVIFAEFDMQLPALTQWVLKSGNFVAQYGLILIPLLLVPLLIMVVSPFYYIGWLTWEPYPLSRYLLPSHSRHVLRTLADQMLMQRPITEAVELMAQSYPTRHVSQRLNRAGRKMRMGAPWCAALEQEGLLDAATRDVLESAERLGNLPWALREMADGGFRRLLRRVSLVLKVLEPTTILMCGAVVAVMCLALMTPLANLIQALT